jgi:hypothetical protein
MEQYCAFRFHLKTTATEKFHMKQVAFGEKDMTRASASVSHKTFYEGREYVADEH